MSIEMPGWLHDVFGARQRAGDLTIVAAFGLGVPVTLIALYPSVFLDVPAWRGVIAVLLILDIAAGCTANLTTGTNDYYATRPRNRWVFIAIHIHLPLVALLLEFNLPGSLAVWAFTIAGAVLVNVVRPGATQRVLAGTLFCVGACGIVIGLSGSPIAACLGMLFMLKVLVHFSVDHRADGR